jgi:hypothetical protein
MFSVRYSHGFWGSKVLTPPATAGGTDPVQEHFWTFEANPLARPRLLAWYLALNNQLVVDSKQTGNAPRPRVRKVLVSLAIHNPLERRSSAIDNYVNRLS